MVLHWIIIQERYQIIGELLLEMLAGKLKAYLACPIHDGLGQAVPIRPFDMVGEHHPVDNPIAE